MLRGATLRVRPEAGRLLVEKAEGTEGEGIDVDGTLDVEGPPLEAGLPVGRMDLDIRIQGQLRLRRVTMDGEMTSQADAVVDLGSVIAIDEFPDTPSIYWTLGRFELAAPEPGFPFGASAILAGGFFNFGTVVGPPSARLVVTGGPYDGPGTVEVSLALANGSMDTDQRVFRVPALAWSRQGFDLDVAGLADRQADRIVVAGAAGQPPQVDLGNGPLVSRFTLVPASGYVPCAGARLQLLTWGQRVAGDPVEPHAIEVAGLAPGLRVRVVERFDGLVAEVTGSSAGVACSDTVGDRLVSGWFVDGLGRPARPEQLTWFGARADAAELRVGAARELLLGEAAVRRFADGEFRRILGRPASVAALRTWTARLRQGWSPDRLRAETYGGAAFWAAAGRTPAGWTRALHRTELGREATAAEVSASVAEQQRGVSRATIAARLLAGSEADRALAARSVALWWSRPATATERSAWAARYQRGAELTVTADLAAATPVG